MEILRNYLNSVRRDFANRPLDESSVSGNPYDLFEKWFEEAVGAQILDPYAMIISTSSKDNQPSSRVVYMRDMIDGGLVFYTNYNSDKAADLEVNPKISALFFWGELERQIRVEGWVVKAGDDVSEKYFASRPRESQIGAWASEQSSVIVNRAELEKKVEELTKKFEGKEVPRPQHWGGFIIQPQRFEFWQGRPNRLHDRLKFEKENNSWKLSRLSP
ncbi:MAG: pyridoxamine 5'-phosphate oxidase [Bacteroidota bacterium]